MTVCIRCHRPLKNPTETGMGPTCRRKAKAAAVPEHERDLFGFDVEKAVRAAQYRLLVQIEGMAAQARMDLKRAFRQARVALGVWAA